ncbi:MAG: Na+/glucose cotransporter, partial [Candidatus Marinimicrobia bacterium]|nr:Na+/glucose cotransporter [Candidatus Neomarinimicrobiota bacterium]
GIVVALGIAWIPLMQNISGELYQYLQSVQSYIAPPIAAVFLLGVFIKRINGYGALSALIGGFAVGMLRLVLELNKTALSGFWFNFANVNFLYFAIYLLLFSVAVMVVVSLLTPAPDQEKINGLTYSTTALEDKEASRKSWNKWDVINSVVIVGLVITIFMYFSG